MLTSGFHHRGTVIPNPFDAAVVCPACGSCAIFTSPYLLLSEAEGAKAAANPPIKAVAHRESFVIERFPDLFPWNDRDNRIINFRNTFKHAGVLYCGHCPYRKKQSVKWPAEAFYKIDFPFGTLWARDRQQLVAIRKAIVNPKRYGRAFSNRLNKVFFLKRNCDRILRGIDDLLAKPEYVGKSKRKLKR